MRATSVAHFFFLEHTMQEDQAYIYEVKCMECGRRAEITVVAGSGYPDSHVSEWLIPQLAAPQSAAVRTTAAKSRTIPPSVRPQISEASRVRPSARTIATDPPVPRDLVQGGRIQDVSVAF